MGARTLATDLFQHTLQQVCVCVYTYTCIRVIERGGRGEGQRGVLVCTCDMIHVGVRIKLKHSVEDYWLFGCHSSEHW